MTYEAAVAAWAAKKLGIDPASIAYVAIETDNGWPGADVTMGDAPECSVTAHLTDRSTRQVIDLFANEDGHRSMYSGRKWQFPDLLDEILGPDSEQESQPHE